MGCYWIYHELFVVSALGYTFYCIFVGQYDMTKWIVPFDIYVPFDTTTFFGWFLLWFVQFNMTIAYITAMVSTTSYFVSCCVYICAVCDHLSLIFNSLNEDFQSNSQQRKKNDSNEKEPNKHFQEYRIKIKKTVDIHNKVYE